MGLLSCLFKALSSVLHLLIWCGTSTEDFIYIDKAPLRYTAVGLGPAVFVMSQKICHHLKSHLLLKMADQTRSATCSTGERLTKNSPGTTPWRPACTTVIGVKVTGTQWWDWCKSGWCKWLVWADHPIWTRADIKGDSVRLCACTHHPLLKTIDGGPMGRHVIQGGDYPPPFLF